MATTMNYVLPHSYLSQPTNDSEDNMLNRTLETICKSPVLYGEVFLRTRPTVIFQCLPTTQSHPHDSRYVLQVTVFNWFIFALRGVIMFAPEPEGVTLAM